ncbi:MAG: VOC family protein [Pseudomonadota bacterium]
MDNKHSVSIEHVNVTVTHPEATAAMLCKIFGWQVRWHGPSQMGGETYHVGTDNQYLAVYTYDHEPETAANSSARTRGGLNHVGVQVADLDEVAERVKSAGYNPYSFGDYEPGKRFYFRDTDDIEYEVVSYS